MKSKVLKLDVREDLRKGCEPFGRIMQAVGSLKPNQDLLLIAPFEPRPLYSVLAGRGLSHQTTTTPEGDYEVLFTHDDHAATTDPAPAPSTSPAPGPACQGSPVIDTDARGLEPPQPLVKILEALAQLPPGATLRAHTDRRPVHLFPHLEERGFAGESHEQPDGHFITYVRPR